MRVFMTGGAGYIGAHVALELLGRGHQVTILTRRPERVPALSGHPSAAMLRGGLEDHGLIGNVLPAHDALVHAAVAWSDEADECGLRDLEFAARLFQAAATSGVGHVIHTSSTAVHRPFAGMMSESDRITTADFYGAAKASAELYLFASCRQLGMRGNVIRPGPTIGPPAAPGIAVNSDRRFATYLGQARSGEDIRIAKNDGRQFVRASDLAKLYAAVLEGGTNMQTYLAVSDEFTPWTAVAELTIAAVGSKSRVVAEDSGLPAPPHRFDTSLVERDFGLVFEVGDAVADHVRYLAANSEGPGIP